MERKDNYMIQMQQAKKRFLTYDQQELIARCKLENDENYLYFSFLSEPCRISRLSGDMEQLSDGKWIDANNFNQVMTALDWLCDSAPHRFLTGRWVNIVSQSHSIHRNLQEGESAMARQIQENPQAFISACQALGGEPLPGADIGYAVELVDGLKIFLKFWYEDEDFPPRLLAMWDENVLQYIRYETTWYAAGLMTARIKEKMEEKQ